MALMENISDAQSMAVRTAHERCTTIVPVASMLRLPAAQTEDPSSRAMQQAAKQKFDMSQIKAVVNCLSRVDGSTAKLKRCVLSPAEVSTNILVITHLTSAMQYKDHNPATL